MVSLRSQTSGGIAHMPALLRMEGYRLFGKGRAGQ